MSEALQYFKALSDETRLRLLCILHDCELSVNELVTILGMGQSRISRHLKILSAAQLLTSRRDGLWVFYTAATKGAGHSFIEAVLPFLPENAVRRADADMAARMIEERAIRTRQFFNAIADDWDVLNRTILGDFDLPAAVCRALPNETCVAVDLGCGTGLVLERLLPHTRRAIGVDSSPRMLELARRRFSPELLEEGGSVSLRIGELDHLPLGDGEASFACINLVMHHLSAPESALREIWRILGPGGVLFVTDFDKHNDESMRNEYGDRRLGFDQETMTTLLHTAGFQVQSLLRRPVQKGLTLLLLRAVRT